MGEGPFALTVAASLAVALDFLWARQLQPASFLRRQPGLTILQIASCPRDRTFCYRIPSLRANDRAPPYTSWRQHNLYEAKWPCSAWQCRYRLCSATSPAHPRSLPTKSMNILTLRPALLFPP